MPNYRSWRWAMLSLLFVGGFATLHLTDGGLWNDEVLSILIAGGDHYPDQSLTDVWHTMYVDHPAHPPTWYLLVWAWGQVTGWSPLAVRMLGLLFGLLTVAVTYRMTREMISPRAGFFATIFLSSSALFLHYTHEARVYTQVTLVVALTIWAYWRTVNGGRRAWLVALFFSCVGLWYTHYMCGVLAGVLGLYHLLRGPRNRRWWVILGIMAVAGATFIVWVPAVFNGSQIAAADAFIRALALRWDHLLEQLITVLANGHVALLAVVGLYVVVAWRARSIQLAGFVMVVTLAVIVIANERVEFLEQARMRYLLVLWPLAALLIGASIDHMTRRGLRPELLLGVWIVIGLWQTSDSRLMIALRQHGSNVPRWEWAVDPLKTWEQPGDALVFFPSWGDKIAVDHYLYELEMPYVVARYGLPPYQDDLARAAALVPEADRFWIVYDDPSPAIIGYTPLHFAVDDELAFCGVVPDIEHFQIYAYIRLPETPAIRFGANLLPPEQTLAFYLMQPPMLADQSQSLTFRLGWSAVDGIPAEIYTIQIVVNEANSGAAVAETEFVLSSGFNLCMDQIIDMRGFLPGDYIVKLNVNAWNALLPGVTTTGREAHTWFVLGEIHIE